MVSFAEVAWFAVGLLTLTLGCPDADLAYPCECIDAFGKFFVKCNGAKTSEEIRKSLLPMADHKIMRLEINRSTLKYIPYESLIHLTLRKLQVTNSSLDYFLNFPLSGAAASSLEEIDINNVYLDEGFAWTSIKNAINLQSLKISGSKLSQIPKSLTLPKLETIQLDGDDIQTIHPMAFSNLKGLRNLILRNNIIQSFERKMLPYPTTNIEFLDLRNNVLLSLPHDVFDGMPKLNSLLLDGNRLTVLHKNFMEKIFHQLFFFSATGNPLECSCDFSWLLQSSHPFHFHGHCTIKNSDVVRELKMMNQDDFADCIV